MAEKQFSQPPEPESPDRVKFTELVGALVAITPREHTTKEYKPGEHTPVVVSDVDVIADSALKGHQYVDVHVNGKVTASQLSAVAVGETILARVITGDKGKQANPPIKLAHHTESDLVVARKFYADLEAGGPPAPAQPPAAAPAAVGASVDVGSLTDEQKAAIAAVLGQK